MGYFKTHLIQFALIGITISFVSDQVLAQSAQTNTQLNYMPQPGVQLPIPSPESQSGFNTPPRRMERTGTAINGARNSVSIKSTDAGIIHYPPAVSAIPRPQHDLSAMHRHSQSNCINCGTIDFIRIIDQERLFDAVTSGVIAGTVIRKMNGNSTHSLTSRTTSSIPYGYSHE